MPALSALPASPARIILLGAALLLAWGTVAQARDLHDPFATESRLQNPPGQPCKPLPANPLSLTDVVDLSLCNNPRTRLAWANARTQAAAVGTAQAAYLPTLEADASAVQAFSGSNKGTQGHVGLTLDYLLYDFGGREAGLETANQRLAALQALQQDTMQAVFLEAAQLYYRWHALRAAVEAAKIAETTANESLKAAVARYDVGKSSPLDKLQFQSAYSQTVLVRVRAESDLSNAQAALANIMGLTPQTPFQLADLEKNRSYQTIPNDNLNTLLAQAKTSRPDLLAAEAELRAAQANIDATKAQGRPSLSAVATQDWNRLPVSGWNQPFAIGLSLNVPLFSGFADTYRIRAAQAAAEASRYSRDQVAQQVALEVVQTFNTLNSSVQSIETSRDLLDSAEQGHKVALGRYKAGVGSMLELLDAQTTLNAARYQTIQAQLNWHIARLELTRAVGQLDKNLLTQP